MSWVTPKTDWQVREYVDGLYSGDWFNLSDYDRLRGNIRHMATFASSVLGVDIPQTAMPARSFGSYPRAGDFNAIESNLLAIVQAFSQLPPGYYSRTDWAENGAFLTFDDLNRIESASAWLWEALQSRARWEAFLPAGEDGLLEAGGELYHTVEDQH